MKHFAEDDKRKAMKYLKPKTQRRESHSVTFFIGESVAIVYDKNGDQTRKQKRWRMQNNVKKRWFPPF